jgi:hypothetical protein
MRIGLCALVCAALLGVAQAQPRVQPVPLEVTPLRGSEPAPTPVPAAATPTPAPVSAVVPPPRTAVSQQVVPPVLPEFPRRRAIEAVALERGRMSYSGPSGALTTAAGGGMCAVTCSLSPPEEYQISCPPGASARCQCDAPPYAECLPQQ